MPRKTPFNEPPRDASDEIIRILCSYLSPEQLASVSERLELLKQQIAARNSQKGAVA